MQVGDVAAVLDAFEAELVGRADGLAALHAGAGQPHREAERVVVAARLADAFAGRRAAELAAPDEQRLVPQAACASGRSIRARDRLVGLAGVQACGW